MADSRAAQAVRAACPEHGDQRRLAERTEIPENTLSRIASGQQSPGRRYAAALLQALGIDLSWWDDPPDEPGREPTEAA